MKNNLIDTLKQGYPFKMIETATFSSKENVLKGKKLISNSFMCQYSSDTVNLCFLMESMGQLAEVFIRKIINEFHHKLILAGILNFEIYHEIVRGDVVDMKVEIQKSLNGFFQSSVVSFVNHLLVAKGTFIHHLNLSENIPKFRNQIKR